MEAPARARPLERHRVTLLDLRREFEAVADAVADFFGG